ncbi:MAG: hypothetical protein IKZ55_08715 [Bacteroidales bacterium]|nr:hypothetical protein [Bacteroidales bacterium]
MKKIILPLCFLAVLLTSCTKPKGHGDLTINIGYSINGKPLITDTLDYENEAENRFLITEIQWFFSKMELQDERDNWIPLEPRIFYIDTNIPESHTLRIASIPVGKYKTLRFVFGLDEEDNQTGLFSDPPEANMFWPEPHGGGYHYIKLNGKYLNENEQLAPLNIHLGIGQNADHTQFYQNYFTVTLPIGFTIAENAENQLDLIMIVDNWFRNPNLYDFNEYGSAIMQNQAAQQALKENGNDVFVTQNNKNQNNMNILKNDILKGFNGLMQKAAPKPHFWTWKSVKERMESPVGTTENRQAV